MGKDEFGCDLQSGHHFGLPPIRWFTIKHRYRRCGCGQDFWPRWDDRGFWYWKRI